MPVAVPPRQLDPISTGRRVLPRNKDFLNKHGHRHHSFDPEKAPYPLSYDRQVLELESLDLSFLLPLTKSVSIASFTDGPPSRSLDLGCGGGTWVVEAAKEWPDCHFVGFDLVDVQVPLSLLEPEIATRINWMHGNFLTTKLPFDDEEFDHVRMNDLGRGIPENKWGVLLEEVNRVLSSGGIVEVIEHDIIFPTLPSWFTAPLRVRNKRSDSIHHPNGSHRREATPPPSSVDTTPLPHDHILLESLYYGVFENRFINLRPTAILPIHFTSNFRQVITAPIVHIRMPAIPPLPALPQPLPANALLMSGDVDKPEAGSQPAGSSDLPTLRPSSVSFFSTDSRRTSHSASTEKSSLFDRSFSVSDVNTQLTSNSGNPSSPSSPKTTQTTKLPTYVVDWSSAESTMGSGSRFLNPLEKVDKLNESTLAMQLYWSYQSVLACQESMWEELADRMRNRSSELRELGWESDPELNELESRAKFEVLVERYKRDMHARVSLWCSLAELGWPVPPREPLSKAELVEEERLHHAMLEARRFASEDDLLTYCRSVRSFVGSKSC
ncbi:S-adenosyl-L-methionine-dependent methyltransferase [Imleria badia]|nr:S-adenosyl-L-methionine-dependent methyltransferase [Imleria badia]